METENLHEDQSSRDVTDRGDGHRPASLSEAAHGGGATPYRPRYTPLWTNLITFFGLFLAAMATLLLLTFGLFSIVTPTTNPYVDIVGYLVLPGLLALGVLIIPVGIFFKSWRVRRRNPEQRLSFFFPRVDLNDPLQRRTAKYFALGTFVLLPVVAVSGYQGYHYTDSAAFCANACHSVMKPQATTYQYSPHARVACAECHIGEGASWFVKSKLSGTRQVLAVWRDTFSRPIPPAIQHLRPARETCERCHWPKKFYGAQLREIVHFASDEKNTPREIDMLLKIGGGDETMGRPAGIHLHMALAGQIEYIATDDKLQEIPWVRYVDKSGNAWIYRSDGRPSSDPRPEGQVRLLDCMDCHNRPAHNFRSPQEALDIYLSAGQIDTTLPYIKREAVAALVTSYPDVETAKIRIGDHLTAFYESQYPHIWEADKASVNNAVDKVREIYERNFFPSMRVDWQTYPDNIGHLISPGCFRCHDGRHVNQRGKPISHDCSVCHTFLNPVEGGNGTKALIQESAFIHPYERQGRHATLRCNKCHTGGLSPPASCEGCHTLQSAFRRGQLEGLTGSDVYEGLRTLDLPADPMADMVDCESCHDLTQPMSLEVINKACLDCHDDEAEKYRGMLATWKDETDRLLLAAEAQADPKGRRLLKIIRQAGPLHNVEATKALVRTIQSAAAERANSDLSESKEADHAQERDDPSD